MVIETVPSPLSTKPMSPIDMVIDMSSSGTSKVMVTPVTFSVSPERVSVASSV